MPSAICFSFDQSKILSSGNGFNGDFLNAVSFCSNVYALAIVKFYSLTLKC